jgi:RNA polymerase sigma factor (sigma-70 family)
MMTTDTQDLLAEFVKSGSERAFRELVSRYVDLVYSTALRLVDGDTHRAEDVAQIVFADLARMASRLSASSTLGGWLHRHTCFVARTVMRGERRRQARERQAVEMKALNDQVDHMLAQISPVLDEAIQELGPDDRDAILLRFFERRNLRSVGEALGVNENVAQKRVSRAVQELGMLLQRHGVSLSAAALASGLAVGAVKAAPAGLGLSIAAKVFTSAGAAGIVTSAPADVAVIAKLKVGIIVALLLAGMTAAIYLHNRAKVPLRNETAMDQPQPVQADVEAKRDPEPPSPVVSTPGPRTPPLTARANPVSEVIPAAEAAGPAAQQRPAVPVQSVITDLTLPIQRFTARSGSRVKIEGTSNLGAWQVESRFIGGTMEIGPGFPAEPGQTLQPGPIPAQAAAFIQVRSLKSIKRDGTHYDDRMDEVMYEHMKASQTPAIYYRLVELSLTGGTNVHGVPCYQFESQGELAIAGVTNEIAIPIMAQRLENGRIRISGEIPLKMSSFRIAPPDINLAFGHVKTDDDVRVLFEWRVSPRTNSAAPRSDGMVQLVLDLPAPAFKGSPANSKLGTNVEPLSDQPRAPMWVPVGLTNLAPGSKLTCSDRNISAQELAKVTDGDKEASDQSIIFLPKGTQWVQMDFGKPQQIFAIVLWHAHNVPKAYHDVIVQADDDPDFIKNVRTIFNNDSDNTSGLGVGKDREYCESYEGKLINAKGIKARYLRFYSKGSTESALNEYTEIEVYGRAVR